MRHPGLVILAPWLKVSSLLELGCLKVSVYLLKLVFRILIETCCLSASSILVLVRASTYRNNVKRRVECVTSPHCYDKKRNKQRTSLFKTCFFDDIVYFYDGRNDDQDVGKAIKYIV